MGAVSARRIGFRGRRYHRCRPYPVIHRNPAALADLKPKELISCRNHLTALATQTFIRETTAITPDEKTYRFLGYLKPEVDTVWVHDCEPAPSIESILKENHIKRRPAQDDDETDAAQAFLLSADGRLFIEHDEVYDRRVAGLKDLPKSGQSSFEPREEDIADDTEFEKACCEPIDAARPEELSGIQAARPTPAVGPNERVLVADDRPLADTIHGSDGRQLIISSAYPWRAVGVSLLRRTSDSGENPPSYSRGNGTGTMIGPRHVLTVAHTFTDGNGIDKVIGAAPAARGYNFQNDPLPHTACGTTRSSPTESGAHSGTIGHLNGTTAG